jgi:putative serine protease PepD
MGNLPAVTIGDSTKVSVGDPVLAIGSPLGLASTVTSGIVSALNRPVSTGTVDAQSYVDAIQTDAAINPGNSGGALIDAQGRIIGVNSAIATLSSGSTSGSIGLGFSIPINEAKRVIDEIIATGKSTRPVLGVFFDTTFTGEGAKIGKLSAGEGAEKAGIPVGAIIRSIDGVKIPNTDTAIVRIRSYAPGAVVTLVVDLPTGGSKTFKVTLGSAPSL